MYFLIKTGDFPWTILSLLEGTSNRGKKHLLTEWLCSSGQSVEGGRLHHQGPAKNNEMRSNIKSLWVQDLKSGYLKNKHTNLKQKKKTMHNLGSSSPVVLAGREIYLLRLNVNPMPQDVNPTQDFGCMEVTWMKSIPLIRINEGRTVYCSPREWLHLVFWMVNE